jgi:hypothetical protein
MASSPLHDTLPLAHALGSGCDEKQESMLHFGTKARRPATRGYVIRNKCPENSYL